MTKVTVTDLSKMAVCEKQYVLGKIHGNPENKKMLQGTINHHHFENSSWQKWERQLSGQKRCYVATALWGEEDARVQQLRLYRDEVLLKSKMGIIFIRFYYLISEKMVNTKFFHYPLIKKIIEKTLQGIIKCLSI